MKKTEPFGIAVDGEAKSANSICTASIECIACIYKRTLGFMAAHMQTVMRKCQCPSEYCPSSKCAHEHYSLASEYCPPEHYSLVNTVSFSE